MTSCSKATTAHGQVQAAQLLVLVGATCLMALTVRDLRLQPQHSHSWSTVYLSADSLAYAGARNETAFGTAPFLEEPHAADEGALYAAADNLLLGQDYGSALVLYQQAIGNAKGTDSEYYGLHRVSLCYQRLNDSDSAAAYAWKALNASGKGDPMYDLAAYYDGLGHAAEAEQYYELASRAPRTSSHVRSQLERVDRSFLWPNTFPDSYLQDLSAAQARIDDADIAGDVRARIHWDMVTKARPILRAGQELFRREGPFRPRQGLYYYGTPTLVQHPDDPKDYLVLARLINYRIDHQGRYYRDMLPANDTSGTLRSSSAIFVGLEAKEGSELLIDDEQYRPRPYAYMGTEDPRLFRMDNGDIRVSWTSWQYFDIVGQGSRTVSGILDLASYTVHVDHLFPSPYERQLEKNWVMFQAEGGALRFLYDWHPLEIGVFDNSSATASLVIDTRVETPPSFRHLRGSTNGAFYRDELWFVAHGTSWLAGPAPVYYHCAVVLDPESFELRRFTYPFRLEGYTDVEFSLGMDIDDEDRMTIAYSVFDGSSVLRRIPMWKLEKLMAPRMPKRIK